MELPSTYNEYSDVFSNSSATELLAHKPANHAIDLVNDKQSLYDPIYNLNKIKLKTLREYIKINLLNNFIRLFTSPTRLSILFVRKFDKGLRLYVDY